MKRESYDAIVVGSGPNGLAAAITLQQQGISVLLIEKNNTIGGGLRTRELTEPGFKHDICSAIHPMAIGSPFFSKLPLKDHGLGFCHPTIAAAHPFDGGRVAFLSKSIEETCASLGLDGPTYYELIQPIVENWPKIVNDALGPLSWPKHPILMGKFGLNAILTSEQLSKRFLTEEAKGLWAGMSAHSIQPLSNWASSAIGLVLLTVGHLHGWPIPIGGSQSIANALGSYFLSIGGEIETNYFVQSLEDLPPYKAVLLDVTPKQILKIAGSRFSPFYKWQLSQFRYGMGVFKIDWALEEPIPFTSIKCREAGTVHLGNTFNEIAQNELKTSKGGHPDKPFVLLAQQSLFDNTRAPNGKHIAWAYCHVPNGSQIDMTNAIENQVERFAPGFKDIIISKNTMNTHQMESYNPNYIGGDINGGIIDIRQLYTRPALRISPYRTSAKGIYICSSSTPPGGGVHGMCGFHAAKQVIDDLFEN